MTDITDVAPQISLQLFNFYCSCLLHVVTCSLQVLSFKFLFLSFIVVAVEVLTGAGV